MIEEGILVVLALPLPPALNLKGIEARLDSIGVGMNIQWHCLETIFGGGGKIMLSLTRSDKIRKKVRH